MDRIIDKYKDPSEIKRMTLEELDEFSQEIREFLIQSVSLTGGHLAPNLGVVELTIALHNIFDFSKDKIIFDVGHQSYVHKILTGRKDAFSSLRKYKGLSGFPKTEESIYDHFNTGHASTSISAALGMARARDLKGEDHSVICLIGDGALTGGMAWEAMNDVGFKDTKLIIILNDNEMSISRNVGAMSFYLSALRSDRTYEKIKKDLQKNLERLPLGKSVSRTAKWMKDSFKAMVVEGMIFENLGLKYLGPVDGHNIKELSKILQSARDFDGPVLVHAVTQKGRGYEFAMAKPDLFHGIAPFDKSLGKVNGSSGQTFSKGFGEALVNLAEDDNRLVAITAAMRDGTGLKEFSLKYPNRFFDVGIAEEHAVTMAGGLAIAGMKPYVAIYSTFLQRSLDQIIHDISLQKLNVTFCIDRAGLVGDDGETHQGIFDTSFLTMIPNMLVMVPKNIKELQNMLKWSLSYDKGPLAIRYPRGTDGILSSLSPLNDFKIGSWEVIKKGKDRDLLILSSGKLLATALEVAEGLKDKTDSTIVNASFLKPIDWDLINSLFKDFKRVLVIEDNIKKGGLGESVEVCLTNLDFKGKVLTFAFNDSFINQGDIASLHEEHGISKDKIISKVLEDEPS